MKTKLRKNFMSISLAGLVLGLLVMYLPPIYSSLIWNALTIAQLKGIESTQMGCPPFYSEINDCLNEVRRWQPNRLDAMWESAWQSFVRTNYDQAAKTVPVMCSDAFTPAGVADRRPQYVIVELLALARHGCASNADALWLWMTQTAPFRWPVTLQHAALRSGALAHEWLAAQGFEPVARRQLAAVELWWLANDQARAVRLITEDRLTSDWTLTSTERAWAYYSLGWYAENTGDNRTALKFYAAALDDQPSLVVASVAQYRLALRVGDIPIAEISGLRLNAYVPSRLLTGDGARLPVGDLVGYDVQPLVTSGPWLNLILVWRVTSTVNNQQFVQRCIQSTITLNYSRYGWLDPSKRLKMIPSPTSSMQPKLLSFPVTPLMVSAASFMLYGLEVDEPTAKATITMRSFNKAGQQLLDMNQSLISILSPSHSELVNGYAAYAVQWPVGATESQVLLTLHAAQAPVGIDRILVAFLAEPDRANTACIEGTN